MITPVVRNLTIYQRATFSEEYTLTDSNGDAINLTGHELLAQIWDADRVILYATFEIVPVNLSEGKFKLYLPSTVTARLEETGYYDLAIKQPNGERYYWVKGTVRVRKGYS